VTKDNRLAAAAALLYTFNPASVFHSTLYTEALFAAASFAGLYAQYHWGSIALATLPNALASLIRSNGGWVKMCAAFLLVDIRRYRASRTSSELLHALDAVT